MGCFSKSVFTENLCIFRIFSINLDFCRQVFTQKNAIWREVRSPQLKQWVSQASGWVPVMLRCRSQMSLSCEWNVTSRWLVVHSEMSMCGFFLRRSFSALFLSSVAAFSSFLDWTLCLQSLLKVIFFISSRSVGCGPVPCSKQPPPAFLRHPLDWLLLQSHIYCLSLPIRNKPWVGFARLFVWTHDPMCSCQERVEKPPSSPQPSNTSGSSLLAQ